MSTFGDKFPPSFVKAFAEQRGITAGDVLYLHCTFTEPPKVKFLLVVCCDPLLVLVINSHVHEYIRLRPTLLACQVELTQQEHDFLSWDSFINCIEAHAAFDIDDLKEMIATDYHNIVKGKVIDICMGKVYKAVESSQTMLRKHKKLILNSLSHHK